MPRPKTAYGWRSGDRFYLSSLPKTANAATNSYASPSEALRDAQTRGMTIEWENRADIDAWRSPAIR